MRLRNTRSGVIVDVPEDVAGRLVGFEPVKAPAAARKSAKTAKKDTREE